MFGKRNYNNIVMVDNEKDALIIAGKEGKETVEDARQCIEQDLFPANIIIKKRRSFIEALRRSWEYSKMGIFNLVVRKD